MTTAPRRCRGCGKKMPRDAHAAFCSAKCQQSNVTYLPGVEKRPQPPGDETA